MNVTVFVRSHLRDPLLCLTASATLRPRSGIALPFDPAAREGLEVSSVEEEQIIDGFEEVNVLEGLGESELFATASFESR